MSAKKDNKFQNIKIPTGKDYVTHIDYYSRTFNQRETILTYPFSC